MPSCRELAGQLGVSRNTVFSAYSRLVDLGLLEARSRSGFFIRKDVSEILSPEIGAAGVVPGAAGCGPLAVPVQERPSRLARIRHPADWADYRYPFIYNQTDPGFFPFDAWRECSRLALNRKTLTDWVGESISGDSPNLLEQLRQRLLTYRGIVATNDEVMITLGAQNALSIIGLLLRGLRQPIAVEDPGFPDARNAFLITGNELTGVEVDEHGLRVFEIPSGCKLAYVTPSHQFPTSVALSEERRVELLQAADAGGFLVLEDDYEAELTSTSKPVPALRSIDTKGVVIYVGSLSKTLSPGLRIGFMVAHKEIIREARAIRHALLRHPPTIIQETLALFIRLGYFDAHLRKFVRRHEERWTRTKDAVEKYLGAFAAGYSFGGTTFWLSGPPQFKASVLCDRLLARGVIVDRGRTFYLDEKWNDDNSFRLGFAYVKDEQIDEGIRLVGLEANRLLDADRD